MVDVNVKIVLAFLNCLVMNQYSPCVIANYTSAIKANFVLHDLLFMVLDYPRVKYYLKSLKIKRPLSARSHKVIDITWLRAISQACCGLAAGQDFRAIFLTGFFAFLRLSNLSAHSLRTFDPSRHWAGEDAFFSKRFC